MILNEAGILAAYAGKTTIGKAELMDACVQLIAGHPQITEPRKGLKAKLVAYHEAGHAVVSEFWKPGSVGLVSIVGSSSSKAGITSEIQEDENANSMEDIIAQKHKFDEWLKSEDSLIVANCLLVLCNRLIQMLKRQIEHLLEEFKEEGGFTEGLTSERLAHRTQKSLANDAPVCPICGKPMIKRVAKKGINSGREFWSCSEYPKCNGTRNVI